MQRLTQILSRPAVWMIAVLLAAFWQVAFCRYTLQWDMTDQAFVWHRYISECFHAHIIPLWAPYSKWGYPMYADPQSGLFYPIVWLFATVGRYTLYSNDLELVIHIVLAAFGMRYLLESLSVTRRTASIFGLVYAMSGPFVGHASHITLIGSLCWMPFLLGSYIRFAKDYRIYDLLLTALFVFLQVTGGYAGAAIILLYVLVIVFLYHFISGMLAHKAALAKVVSMHLLLVITIFMMAGGFLYAVAQGQPYMDRGEGISRATAGDVPFTPKSLLTAIYPGVVGTEIDFGTNGTMQDIYIGLMSLILIAVVLLKKRRLSSYLIFGGSIFWLLAAMGDHTPVRGWLYDYVPLMNLFRHAGIFRFFTVIGFIVLAARGFDAIEEPGSLEYKVATVRLMALLLTGTAAVSIFLIWSGSPTKVVPSYMVMQVQTVWLTVSLVCIGFLFFIDRISWGLRRNAICILILADMLISVQSGIYTTVVSDRRVNRIQAQLDRYPKDFPIPANVSITSYNQWNDATIAPPIWQNAGFIRKQLSFEGDNRFNLKTYGELAGRPDFFQHFGTTDLARSEGGGVVSITGFDPCHFTLDVMNEKGGNLILAQMYFPGWKASVDGATVPVSQSADHFVSCAVPAGKHRVELAFAPTGARVAFIYTVIMFFVLLIAIAISRRRLS